MTRILIGTSGWHYDSWRGPFFPQGLPLKHQLHYYASQFDSTELNGVFYRTPTPESVNTWREQTGKDFVFAWKASKFITHWKRLSDACENSLDLLEDRAKILRGKLGPILFQLPPQFEANADRLASFFRLLPKRRRYSFEFRHPSWYQSGILRMLADNNAALTPQHLLIDAKRLKEIDIPQNAIIKGDAKSASIAAASILAKVERDAVMRTLDLRHPGYGFADHKGYPVPAHYEALARLGACAAHRRSFGPVRKALGLPPLLPWPSAAERATGPAIDTSELT